MSQNPLGQPQISQPQKSTKVNAVSEWSMQTTERARSTQPSQSQCPTFGIMPKMRIEEIKILGEFQVNLTMR